MNDVAVVEAAATVQVLAQSKAKDKTTAKDKASAKGKGGIAKKKTKIMKTKIMKTVVTSRAKANDFRLDEDNDDKETGQKVLNYSDDDDQNNAV